MGKNKIKKLWNENKGKVLAVGVTMATVATVLVVQNKAKKTPIYLRRS